jgi:hypothetical protein
MANVNVIEFMASVSDANSRVSPTNLDVLQALTGLSCVFLTRIRGNSLQKINLIKWNKKWTRMIKNHRLQPASSDQDPNYVHPGNGLVYHIPDYNRYEPGVKPAPSLALKNKLRLAKIQEFKATGHFDMHNPWRAVFTLDCIFINSRTKPKLIRNTLCLDRPDDTTIALSDFISTPVMRYKKHNEFYYEAYVLIKNELVTRHVYWGDEDIVGMGKTPQGAKLSYKAKVKKRVLLELQGN